MLMQKSRKGRTLRIALAVGAIAMAAAPALAAPKKTVGPPVAAGQTRYLVEYNPGNKQAIANLVAAQGGRVVYDYSALLNGFAIDLSDQGVKSLRTSGLAKTIEADAIRTLHGEVRRSADSAAEDAFLAARAARSAQSATTTTSAKVSTPKATQQSSTRLISTTSSVQGGSSSSSEGGNASAFIDGGVAAPDALPGGFPNGVFSEFVPWDRDRVNADVVWSVGPNFGVADNGVATPDVAPGSVTGEGVVVGLLDTGVDYDHPDLAANLIDDRGDTTIRNYLEMLPGAEDLTFNGHGTSTASVIASVDNDVGLIGVAPGAKIRPYRVCDGSCPISAIIAGVVQATVDGVDVINMSFGGGAGKNFEAAALQAANQAGIVLVASAGNEASQKVHFPAGYDTVIAVGATDINDNPASFTNYGGWVDVTGPGVNNPTATCTGCVTAGVVDELSPTAQSFQSNGMTNSPITLVTNQEVVYVGRACSSLGDALASDPSGKVALITRGSCSFAEKVAFAESAGAIATIVRNNAAGNFFGTLGAYIPAGPSVSISQADGALLAADIATTTTTADVGVERTNIQYWFISGTSFSGPHVAGVAALVKSANPSLSAIEVRKIIESTAEPIGAQVIFGGGIVRADRAVQAAQP